METQDQTGVDLYGAPEADLGGGLSEFDPQHDHQDTPEPVVEPTPEPQPAAAVEKPKKDKKPKKDYPDRHYVLLEEVELEGGVKAYVRVNDADGEPAVITAKNSGQAERLGLRLLHDTQGADTATVQVLPKRSWRPKALGITTRATVTPL